MNNPAESQGAVAGPGWSSPAGGCHPPFPPREKSNLLLLWSRASLASTSSSASSATIHNSLCDIFLFVSYSQAAAAGQSPIISQSKCLGWKLWIVWLRSPAWSAGVRGSKVHLHSVIQHYTTLYNIPGTVVTLLPTIREQQPLNTIYSTTTTVLTFLFTIVCCAWQAQYFCHRPLNNSAEAQC